MSNGGWIKLHRCLLDKAAWKICTDGQKAVLITILLLANREPQNWLWKGDLYECQAGQLITSLPALAKASGASVQTVRSALAKLEKAGFLTSESSPEGRLITVTNWVDYQGIPNRPPTDGSTVNSTDNQQTTQQTANRPTNGNPTDYTNTEKQGNTRKTEDNQQTVNRASSEVLTRRSTDGSTVNSTDNQQTTQQLTRRKEEKKREGINNKYRGIPPISPRRSVNAVPEASQEDLMAVGVPPALCEQVSEWVSNRDAKGETLTQGEFKSFVSMVNAKATQYGAKAVSDLIGEAMSNGYKGVPWDRLERRARDKPANTFLQDLMEAEV